MIVPTLYVRAYVWAVLTLPSPAAEPVYDTQADGFAASIVPAFLILGVLILAAIWTSKRPRNRQRRH
ncbi:MAG: hypothetical protein ACR2LI_00775 [Propionibacteriaceae bacterium]